MHQTFAPHSGGCSPARIHDRLARVLASPTIWIVVDYEGWNKAGDHLHDGMAIANALSYARDSYLFASLGKQQDGSSQVLILGRSHIEIVEPTGTVLLDVGLREIRGVHRVEGLGLRVNVTGRDLDGFRKRQWDHRVSDSAASELESAWLNCDPSMHDGVQINSRPWREEEYAYYIGRVLTEAALCEVLLSNLLTHLERLGLKLARSPRGLSGSALADLLDDVGENSSAFRDIGERYRAWYDWRNFSAHGIRENDAEGKPSSRIFKMKRKPDDSGEEFEVRDQDFKDLARLWSGFYSLGHDARRAYIDLLSIRGDLGDLDTQLSQLPMPNSATPENRFP